MCAQATVQPHYVQNHDHLALWQTLFAYHAPSILRVFHPFPCLTDSYACRTLTHIKPNHIFFVTCYFFNVTNQLNMPSGIGLIISLPFCYDQRERAIISYQNPTLPEDSNTSDSRQPKTTRKRKIIRFSYDNS